MYNSLQGIIWQVEYQPGIIPREKPGCHSLMDDSLPGLVWQVDDLSGIILRLLVLVGSIQPVVVAQPLPVQVSSL